MTTATVNVGYAGTLAEDVNGSNIAVSSSGQVTAPADIKSSATNREVAVVFDEDGSVINALYGAGASAADDCQSNGVITYVDNFSTAGYIVHGVMLINGLCATTSGQLANLQYQVMRGFGRLLGLDWSQANEEMFVNDQLSPTGLQGWPIMHPVERLCNGTGVACMPNLTTLRPDDIAAANRLYPVTAANISGFTGKKIAATATISVTGTIRFKNGQGMQGVNVVLRPLTNGLPDLRYTVTAVSGAYYQGNAGNRINGPTDAQGNPLNRFGSDDPSLEGYFDLSGVVLPTGVTTSDYQLTFEPINPDYVQEHSVGPYVTGQVTPSGTMPVITLHGLSAGSAVTENVVIDDSAEDQPDTLRGSESSEEDPAAIPEGGEWTSRLISSGQAVWFEWYARANREFTIEGQALDETGSDTENKAQVLLGLWNGTDAAGTLPVTGTLQPFNADVVGLTTLPAITTADSEVRLGIEDGRGDGRPDYVYRGRVLYADTVSPARLPVSGGPIVIEGIGFRLNSTVTVNGVPAAVTSVSPTEITAVAPASGGVTGNVLVQVQDPQTLGIAVIEDGLSYQAENGDLLAVVTAPSGSVSMGVPLPFTVRALDETGQLPAAGVTVTFTVTEGAAALSCGAASCSAITAADGTATVFVSASSASLTQITASLTNGATTLAEFTGIAPPSIAAVTPSLYLAIGATVTWNAQALVLNNGSPMSGQSATLDGTQRRRRRARAERCEQQRGARQRAAFRRATGLRRRCFGRLLPDRLRRLHAVHGDGGTHADGGADRAQRHHAVRLRYAEPCLRGAARHRCGRSSHGRRRRHVLPNARCVDFALPGAGTLSCSAGHQPSDAAAYLRRGRQRHHDPAGEWRSADKAGSNRGNGRVSGAELRAGPASLRARAASRSKRLLCPCANVCFWFHVDNGNA